MHGRGTPGADGEIDRIKILMQILQHHMGTEGFVCHDFYTELFNQPDFLVEGRFGETVFGNAVAHHSAGMGLTFKHGYVVTVDGAVISGGESGGTGTDHSDFFAGGRLFLGDKRGVLV